MSLGNRSNRGKKGAALRQQVQADGMAVQRMGLEAVRGLPVDFSEKPFQGLVDYATVHSDGQGFTFRGGAEIGTEI